MNLFQRLKGRLGSGNLKMPSHEKELTATRDALEANFRTGATRPLAWRLKQLKNLQRMCDENADLMAGALGTDLARPIAEAVGEVANTRREIKDAISNLPGWVQPSTSWAPLLVGPSTCETRNEPFGAVLIIGPFNYPVNLCIAPMIGALAAGCTVMLKPSEQSPATERLFLETIPKYFDSDVVSVAVGDYVVASILLKLKWQFVFFTGSPRVGKIVAEACAKQLTPYILELGGKAPVIIPPSCASVTEAARRIGYAKFVNCGQTCIAPDYVMVHEDLIDAFCDAMVEVVTRFYTTDPKTSKDYGRMVATGHTARMLELIVTSGGEILCGGADTADVDGKYVPPTLIRSPDRTSKLMLEEIFGPVLPILPFSDLDECITACNEIDVNPLALYVFSSDKADQEKCLNSIQSGDAIINDCFMHCIVPSIPFGGVGNSGNGHYHGKYTFEAFCYKKGVLHRPGRFCLSYTLPTPEGNIKDPPSGPLREKGLPYLILYGPALPPAATLYTWLVGTMAAIVGWSYRDALVGMAQQYF